MKKFTKWRGLHVIGLTWMTLSIASWSQSWNPKIGESYAIAHEAWVCRNAADLRGRSRFGCIGVAPGRSAIVLEMAAALVKVRIDPDSKDPPASGLEGWMRAENLAPSQ